MPKNSSSRKITRRDSSHATTSRKRQHVELTLSEDVRFRLKRTGLDRFEFLHNALPELDLDEVDTTIKFLGRHLRLPIMISCMTGGYQDALKINRDLAEICEEETIAMGVGSQRQALENSAFHQTFKVVREVAPNIPIIGNIGAAEVANIRDVAPLKRLAEMIRADAFAVHLNPLQEFLQPEGSPNFRGVLEGIQQLVNNLGIPIIVKEIGAGISGGVAKRLLDVGVRIIDVAGAGGTSWAGVESLRRKEKELSLFWDWGIPTAESIQQIAKLKETNPTLTIIGSGGITNGMEAAKSLALGADLVASARPFLTTLVQKKKTGLREFIHEWEETIRGAMFLTGSRNIDALQNARLVEY